MVSAAFWPLLLLAWPLARAWQTRHPVDPLGTVEPRPFMEGGTFWHNGRRVLDRWDSDHAARVVAARRQMDEYGEGR